MPQYKLVTVKADQIIYYGTRGTDPTLLKWTPMSVFETFKQKWCFPEYNYLDLKNIFTLAKPISEELITMEDDLFHLDTYPLETNQMQICYDQGNIVALRVPAETDQSNSNNSNSRIVPATTFKIISRSGNYFIEENINSNTDDLPSQDKFAVIKGAGANITGGKPISQAAILECFNKPTIIYNDLEKIELQTMDLIIRFVETGKKGRNDLGDLGNLVNKDICSVKNITYIPSVIPNTKREIPVSQEITFDRRFVVIPLEDDVDVEMDYTNYVVIQSLFNLKHSPPNAKVSLHNSLGAALGYIKQNESVGSRLIIEFMEKQNHANAKPNVAEIEIKCIYFSTTKIILKEHVSYHTVITKKEPLYTVVMDTYPDLEKIKKNTDNLIVISSEFKLEDGQIYLTPKNASETPQLTDSSSETPQPTDSSVDVFNHNNNSPPNSSQTTVQGSSSTTSIPVKKLSPIRYIFFTDIKNKNFPSLQNIFDKNYIQGLFENASCVLLSSFRHVKYEKRLRSTNYVVVTCQEIESINDKQIKIISISASNINNGKPISNPDLESNYSVDLSGVFIWHNIHLENAHYEVLEIFLELIDEKSRKIANNETLNCIIAIQNCLIELNKCIQNDPNNLILTDIAQIIKLLHDGFKACQDGERPYNKTNIYEACIQLLAFKDKIASSRLEQKTLTDLAMNKDKIASSAGLKQEILTDLAMNIESLIKQNKVIKEITNPFKPKSVNNNNLEVSEEIIANNNNLKEVEEVEEVSERIIKNLYCFIHGDDGASTFSANNNVSILKTKAGKFTLSLYRFEASLETIQGLIKRIGAYAPSLKFESDLATNDQALVGLEPPLFKFDSIENVEVFLMALNDVATEEPFRKPLKEMKKFESECRELSTYLAKPNAETKISSEKIQDIINTIQANLIKAVDQQIYYPKAKALDKTYLYTTIAAVSDLQNEICKIYGKESFPALKTANIRNIVISIILVLFGFIPGIIHWLVNRPSPTDSKLISAAKKVENLLTNNTIFHNPFSIKFKKKEKNDAPDSFEILSEDTLRNIYFSVKHGTEPDFKAFMQENKDNPIQIKQSADINAFSLDLTSMNPDIEALGRLIDQVKEHLSANFNVSLEQEPSSLNSKPILTFSNKKDAEIFVVALNETIKEAPSVGCNI